MLARAQLGWLSDVRGRDVSWIPPLSMDVDQCEVLWTALKQHFGETVRLEGEAMDALLKRASAWEYHCALLGLLDGAAARRPAALPPPGCRQQLAATTAFDPLLAV